MKNCQLPSGVQGRKNSGSSRLDDARLANLSNVQREDEVGAEVFASLKTPTSR